MAADSMSPFRFAVRTLFTAMPIKGARTMNEDRETLFARGEEYLSGDGPQDLTSALDCFRRSAYGFRDDEYFFLKIRAAFPGIQ